MRTYVRRTCKASNTEPRTTARSPRSGRVHRLAAACVFLLAAAVVSSFPAPARAADITLVSNFSNARASNAASLNERVNAQGFQTGAHAAGYTVSEIDLKFDTGRRTQSWPVVTLVKDSVDGSETTALTPPTADITTRRDDLTGTYTVPAGTTLAASSTYYVIISYCCEGRRDNVPDVVTTAVLTETGESGFSIDDLFKIERSGIYGNYDGEAISIAVRGAAKSSGATAPSAPLDLNTTPNGRTQIDLTWTAPTDDGGQDITGYKIEVSTDGGNAFSDLVADTGDTDTTHSDTGLETGQTRHYRVSAINSAGTSDPSNVADALVAVAPGAPTLTATENGPTRIDLSWIAPTDDGGQEITDYNIEVSTTGSDPWFLLHVRPYGETTYSHDQQAIYRDGRYLTPPLPGQTYYYRVSAINAIGEGSPGAANATTAAAATCSLPNLTGRTTIRTATMWVGQNAGNGFTRYGWFSPSNNTFGDNEYGAIDRPDRNFSIGSNNYGINGISLDLYNPPSNSNHRRLSFGLSGTGLTAADKSKLQLHVCGDTFSFANAGNNDYSWNSTGLDWSNVAVRTLRMSVPAPNNATLSGLAISPGTLNETFAPATESYTATVGGAVSRITVTPTTAHAGATVAYLDGDDQALTDADTNTSNTFEVDLSVGANVVKVKVTSSDSTTTKTYTLTITRPATDATLSGLAISPGTLNETFAPATGNYTATVGGGVSRITVTPIKNDSNASVAYFDGSDEPLTDADTGTTTTFEVDLSTGANVVKVKVTAGDATTTKTYTLTITRPSTDATLSGLAISPGTLNETFAPATGNYTATVGSGVSRITVTPTKSNSNASVAYFDGSDEPLTDADTGTTTTFEVDLSTGVNVVKVKVTAGDATTARTYTLTITRPATDATLSGLAISPGTLNETFAPETGNYTATVGGGVSRITVTPTKNDSNASVAYFDGSDEPLTDADTGSANTFEVDLATGANVVKVRVTAQDGQTVKTYALTITRPSTDATLSNLTLSRGALSPAFVPPTTEYATMVASGVSRVTVTPTKNDSNASVAYFDGSDEPLTDADTGSANTFEVDLATGANVVKVKVTAEDATTARTYTLTITRHSSDATLSALDIGVGTLSPAFVPATTEYTARVANVVSRVTVTPQTNHPGASVAYLDGSDQPLTDADTGTTNTFEVDLAVADNVVKVRVTPEDAAVAKKTYTLTITRLSTDATLSGLSLSQGTLTPAFAPATLAYTADVANAVDRLAVTPETNHPAASVAYFDGNDQPLTDLDTNTPDFDVALVLGANVVKVRVTAQDGQTTRTYTATITRHSTDASLSTLSLSEGTLTPAFAPATPAYTADVANAVSRVTVTPTTNHPNANFVYLDGDGQPLTDADTGTPNTFEVDLVVAENVVKVQVTAEDSIATQTYTVTITRLSADATLRNLALIQGTPESNSDTAQTANAGGRVTRSLGTFRPDFNPAVTVYTATAANAGARVTQSLTLRPEFDPAVTVYTATAGNLVSRVTLSPEANHPAARVEPLDRNDRQFADEDEQAEGLQVDLRVGATLVKLRVTAQDGQATNDYSVTVTRRRKLSTDAALSVLALDEGELAPVFDPGVTAYTSVGLDVSRVTVWAAANNQSASVEYLDRNDQPFTDAGEEDGFQVDLTEEESVIKLRVTAENGVKTNDYVLTLIRGALPAAGLPGAPWRARARAEGPSTIALSWRAPANDGGSAITGYRIEVSEDGASWSDLVPDSSVPDTTHRHTGLYGGTTRSDLVPDSSVPDTTYRHTGLYGGTTRSYRVSAINASGMSVASAVATVTTEAGPPGPPRNLRGAGGEKRVALSWSAPENDGGSAITRYEYEVDGSGSWTNAGAELTATATGLVNGQAYAFRVRAANTVGAGEPASVRVVAGRLDRVARGWLVRFSRESANHVSGAIEERLRGGSTGVVFGGQRLPMERKASGEPNADTAGTAALPARGDPASVLAGAARPRRALHLRTGEDVSASWRGLRISEALLASSFHLAFAENTDAGSRWSAWGRGARSNFEGREGELTLKGQVTTATLGMDIELGPALIGVAIARSEGDGTFQMRDACSDCEDSAESDITGVYPYARYRWSERLSMWGAAGRGQGELRLRPDDGAVSIETDIRTSMAAAGVRGVLLPASMARGFEIAVRLDFLLAFARADKAAGLPEIDAEAMRGRLLLEGSRSFKFGVDGVLTPSVEVGLRHERGDAEQGSGLEVGGALRYAAKRLTVEGSARALVKHQEDGYEEWGVSGSVRYAPGANERGLSLRLGSGWGAESGGAERLWAQRGFAGGNFDPQARLGAEVGYGLDAPRGLLTPYTGVALTGNGETWRAGARWKIGPAFEVNLEASLREPAGDEKPTSGILLKGSKRW